MISAELFHELHYGMSKPPLRPSFPPFQSTVEIPLVVSHDLPLLRTTIFPAYFTVTVQQSTIDQWRMSLFHYYISSGSCLSIVFLGIHGGRTTFMARGTNANKVSVRLAPFVGVIDGTTGKPAGRPPHISTGDHQQLSSIGDLTAETSSRWRLPVLIFCGKDDEGMSLEDEEYLGRPL
jgi:hypothetical protein